MNEPDTIAQIGEFIAKRQIYQLVLLLFNFRLTPTQVQIVTEIFYGEYHYFSISAYTQWGKTQTFAIACALMLLFRPNSHINFVGPLEAQAQKIRRYIGELLSTCPFFAAAADISIDRKEDRFKKEASKSRLTFKNGNEYEVFSAEGTGNRLMGMGGNIIGKDEACLLSAEADSKIDRMVGGHTEDFMIIELFNPWSRNNNAYRHTLDEDYRQYHVDWRVGVKEGRITEAFVEKQRKTLSPIHFEVLYESKFPSTSDKQLISGDDIDLSKNKIFRDVVFTQRIAGLDCAEEGNDKSVLTIADYYPEGDVYKIIEIISWDKNKPVELAHSAAPYLIRHQVTEISVDAIGVGSGTAEELARMALRGEIRAKVNARKVGASPLSQEPKLSPSTRQEERQKTMVFVNQKAEFYWRTKDLFDKGRISIPDNPELITQLLSLEYDITSGKVKIIDDKTRDKGGKSPDFADSLMLLTSAGISHKKKVIFSFG